jgi:hypothetical protein
MSKWQPIETAPKGGTDIVPVLLATFGNEERFDGIAVGYFDLYYAEGGSGYKGGNGWVILEGEEYRLHYAGPTHWQPLPRPLGSTPKRGEHE